MQAVDGDRTSSTLEPHVSAPDWAVESIAPPDWLAPATRDSARGSGAESLDAPRSDGTVRAESLDAPRSDASVRAESLDAPAPHPAVLTTAAPIRRTVVIRGRGAEGHLPWPDASPRRPQRRAYERAGFRPDRLAMWAVLLGFLLVLVAILSAH